MPLTPLSGESQDGTSPGYRKLNAKSRILAGGGTCDFLAGLVKSLKFTLPMPGRRSARNSEVIGATMVTSFLPCSAWAHANRPCLAPTLRITRPLAFFHASGGAVSVESGG